MIDEPSPPEASPNKPVARAEEKRHDDHEHGFAPHFLPQWIQERWALLTVAVAGLALAVGFFGGKFLGLPPSVALGFYLLAYRSLARPRLLSSHRRTNSRKILKIS